MLDVQFGQLGFTKSSIIAEIAFSLSRTLNRGQLNLDHFKFWQLTSQLLALDVCLSDALRKIHFKQMCMKSHW
ncbi:DUF645 family protein [Vibrio metoecus]|uniref:DUF645 family protein n=1 Tax=Vibrio metoecus TaxID=1481663 RepID=UPI00272DB0FE|nr:DUF645 family protein [Vibrio metoecus]WKY95354.1 DUF645 family protein [Vibrio metoecus]